MLMGILLLMLLVIALLAIPIRLTFKISHQQVMQSDIQLCWMFGLLRKKFYSDRSKKSVSKSNKMAEEALPSKSRVDTKNRPLSIIKDKAFRQRISRYIKQLWCAVDKKDLHIQLRIGLGDPADTGELWALMGPLSGVLSTIQSATIRIEPEFYDPTFELDSRGTITIIPLQLIYLTLLLLLSPTIWQGIKKMRAVES